MRSIHHHNRWCMDRISMHRTQVHSITKCMEANKCLVLWVRLKEEYINGLQLIKKTKWVPHMLMEQANILTWVESLIKAIKGDFRANLIKWLMGSLQIPDIGCHPMPSKWVASLLTCPCKCLLGTTNLLIIPWTLILSLYQARTLTISIRTIATEGRTMGARTKTKGIKTTTDKASKCRTKIRVLRIQIWEEWGQWTWIKCKQLRVNSLKIWDRRFRVDARLRLKI